ncbi:hypothetical protein BDN72DRAFT_681562 [Pluteus cervinus]|uniref:Uncharacterized protein n=1 Tax=Pluteus cervinus TaxID=181527 RepID=A0ACD3ASE0_9AGAR|nr:hypothetical protein BDN72DRAFT_681562 [Pluteus cervinus]
MTTLATDPGYRALLDHLHTSELRVSLPTLQAALAQQLATTSPSPTPLTATVISSPIFSTEPFVYHRLHALSTAFRHAVHLRFRVLTDGKQHAQSSVFFRVSLRTELKQWVQAVVQGLQGGNPAIRTASCSGLLLGFEDLKAEFALELDCSVVDDELLVGLASVLDSYPPDRPGDTNPWERELLPSQSTDVLSFVLIIASQSIPLVRQEKLKAFPLAVLLHSLTSILTSTFRDGNYLSLLPGTVVRVNEGQRLIPLQSTFALVFQEMVTSPQMRSISALSKLTAFLHATLLTNDPEQGVDALSTTLRALCSVASNIEKHWCQSFLSSASIEDDIAPESRSLSRSIWTSLKTILFCVIMIADAGLSADLFLPPKPTGHPLHHAPQEHALSTLHTFAHLAFVISQFGGVTTTSTHAFKELKKTFYLAIDVLAYAPLTCEKFVDELHRITVSNNAPPGSVHAVAQKAYVLAAIEQLVPVLTPQRIENFVFPICYPHLTDPSHRETFESAHSVILSIFSAHARGAHAPQAGVSSSKDEPSHGTAMFIQRLVPSYSRCLIENSVEGKLSTDQLRLAYAALVRSASTSAIAADQDATYTLAWYCVTQLLGAIDALRTTIDTQTRGATENAAAKNQLHRLHLTLISTVSSLPLPLLARVLEEVRIIIVAYQGSDSGAAPARRPRVKDKGRHSDKAKAEQLGKLRSELVEALFTEILEKVGDREKEEAMRWWYDHREKLVAGDRKALTVVGENRADASKKAIELGEEGQSHTYAASRL